MATSPFEDPARNTHLGPSAAGWLEIGDHRLYWERYGDSEAPPVVLLHHGLGSIRSWRRQIPAFAAAGWQVIAYDRWGYGRSDPRPGFEEGYLLDDTREAVALLDALNLPRVSLVGHSDGGTIALLMAAENPERVERMVVVAAHIYIEPEVMDGLRGILERASKPPLATALQREHGERAAALVEAWAGHWLNAKETTLSMQHMLPKISCPTLVIQGELDEHATPQHAIDIAEGVRHGRLWLIPGVYHMPPHEIPENFNRQVLVFLGGGLDEDAE